ncbi:tail fiber domain-containing protein [Serratia sp. (in: enterobacteria)]|uniref:tail fiber domain-containing protein n=1 Tax=Serratia sp. (in: enterobacteria) TaxID=616 RepID=UPI0028A104F0|nr:tail fiber domain-containing protein [Serratia sp. (in: enterobacteria)]
MPVGTLTLTSNSIIVKGTGTAFNTELKSGDFIVSVVGGVTYTLPVKTVDNATQATLVKAYDGSTQVGVAWNAVPRDAMNAITAQLAAETAKALRGLNFDKENWQQVFSGTGNITITMPDGSSFTGPAWNSITAALENKATKGVNNDITQLSALSTVITVSQGGTGAKDTATARANLGLGNSAMRNVGTTSGTVAAGDDGRLGTVNNKSGGRVTSDVALSGNLSIDGWDYVSKSHVIKESDGTNIVGGFRFIGNGDLRADLYHYERVGQHHLFGMHVYGGGGNSYYEFRNSGDAYAPGSWNVSSDRRLKTEINNISNALDKIKSIGGYTYLKEGRKEAGVIAQEVQRVVPESVSASPFHKQNGEVIDDCLNININGVVALLIEAVKELSIEVNNMKSSSNFHGEIE